MGKQFYVNTEHLKKVATQIEDLLEAINNDDATPGTPKNFQQAGSIDAPTASFWSGKNALAEAYKNEWTYVNDTYRTLVEQLQTVHTACSSTVTQYAKHETNSRDDVRTAGQM